MPQTTVDLGLVFLPDAGQFGQLTQDQQLQALANLEDQIQNGAWANVSTPADDKGMPIAADLKTTCQAKLDAYVTTMRDTFPNYPNLKLHDDPPQTWYCIINNELICKGAYPLYESTTADDDSTIASADPACDAIVRLVVDVTIP